MHLYGFDLVFDLILIRFHDRKEFLHNQSLSLDHQLSFKVIWMTIVWVIWKERNNMIFN